MKPPSLEMVSRLTRVAELRANGSSWVKVGEKLGRSAETCRKWPRRYPEEWRRVYRQAEGHLTMQGSAEAMLVHRSLLQSANERVRLAAANTLNSKRQMEIAREERAARPLTASLSPEIAQFITLLKGLTHDQFEKYLADLVARYAREAASGGAAGPAAPGPAQPR